MQAAEEKGIPAEDEKPDSLGLLCVLALARQYESWWRCGERVGSLLDVLTAGLGFRVRV
jgi:hypothetical protein